MIDRDILASRQFRIAAVVLFTAIIIVGWSLSRALRMAEVPTVPPPQFATADALNAPERGSGADVRAIVALNVFSPERSAPSRRYRLSGYAEEAPQAAAPPQPVVLGTAVSTPERSFAICRVGDTPARVVRVGDRVGAFTVTSIERGRVVFTTPSGERLAIAATGTQS